MLEPTNYETDYSMIFLLCEENNWTNIPQGLCPTNRMNLNVDNKSKNDYVKILFITYLSNFALSTRYKRFQKTFCPPLKATHN